MTVRARYLVAAAVGLCAAHLLPAQEPAQLGLERNSLSAPRSTYQQLADAVAHQLRQGGRLRDYRIDIVCREGLVELSGSVTDQAQREEALRLVQGVTGVERVLDRLTLPADAGGKTWKVWVGLWRIQAGDRIHVRDAGGAVVSDDRVLVGTLDMP